MIGELVRPNAALGPAERRQLGSQFVGTLLALIGPVVVGFEVARFEGNSSVFLSLLALPLGWITGPPSMRLAQGDPRASDMLFYRVFLPVGFGFMAAAVAWAALFEIGYPFLLGANLACFVLSGVSGYAARWTYGLRWLPAAPSPGS